MMHMNRKIYTTVIHGHAFLLLPPWVLEVIHLVSQLCLSHCNLPLTIEVTGLSLPEFMQSIVKVSICNEYLVIFA